ncbi:MAG: hypothetical protein K8T20_10760, partial [Planctomycetes bacterium]|nr:hypothetical protein [Planctomycetota bacterium]
CGGGSRGIPRAGVEGGVTLGGESLKEGAICFIPLAETKGPAAAAPIKDGRYAVPVSQGPVSGKYQVRIEASPAGDLIAGITDPEALSAYVRKHGLPPAQVRVPARYNRQSILTVDVRVGGENKFDFQLEPEAPGVAGRR